MNSIEKDEELTKRIIAGLEKAFEKLLEFKKQKKSDLVIMRDNKIIRIKPEELDTYFPPK